MKIGFIGLGAMGRGMAANLQKAGHTLTVSDLSRDAAASHLANGAVWADSPRQLAQASDIVFTSLPTPADVDIRIDCSPKAAGQGVAVASAGQGNDVPTRSPLAIGIPRNMTETGQIRANNALHSLFRNGGDTASAKALRKAWGGFAEARLNKDAPSFFPRNGGVQVASVSPDQVMGTMSDVAPPSPLSGFEALAPVEAAPKPVDVRQTTTKRAANGRPLDLTKFLSIKR